MKSGVERLLLSAGGDSQRDGSRGAEAARRIRARRPRSTEVEINAARHEAPRELTEEAGSKLRIHNYCQYLRKVKRFSMRSGRAAPADRVLS